MSAAFGTIAVIGLIEVLEKLPGALQKGIDWLHGWTAAAEEAFKKTTKDAVEFEEKAIRLEQRLRAVALIGKEGMEKYHLAAVINSEDMHDWSAAILQMTTDLQHYQAVVASRSRGLSRRTRSRGCCAVDGGARTCAGPPPPPGTGASGFPAWFTWLTVHIFLLIGFRNRLSVMAAWAWTYFTFTRGARLITGDQASPGWTE